MNGKWFYGFCVLRKRGETERIARTDKIRT